MLLRRRLLKADRAAAAGGELRGRAADCQKTRAAHASRLQIFGINLRARNSAIEYCAAALSGVPIPALQLKLFPAPQQVHPVGAGRSIVSPATM